MQIDLMLRAPKKRRSLCPFCDVTTVRKGMKMYPRWFVGIVFVLAAVAGTIVVVIQGPRALPYVLVLIGAMCALFVSKTPKTSTLVDKRIRCALVLGFDGFLAGQAITCFLAGNRGAGFVYVLLLAAAQLGLALRHWYRIRFVINGQNTQP